MEATKVNAHRFQWVSLLDSGPLWDLSGQIGKVGYVLGLAWYMKVPRSASCHDYDFCSHCCRNMVLVSVDS